MRCRVSSGRSVAVALALVAWLAWPGAAVAQSVSGAATAVWATAGTTTALAATGPLANSDDARVASELTGPILVLGSAEALHAATISSIDAWDALDEVTSQAALGNLALTVAGNQISADFALAWAAAPVGAASTGGSTVEGLLVNGIPILPTGAPNERFDLPGATLILNEVQTTTEGTTVNALHIATWDGLVKVVIASATAGVTLIFRNNINTDVHTTVKDIQTAVAVTSGTKVVIPKQPVLGGTGGNPWIWIQLLDNDGNPLTGEIFLGRCVQGLFHPVNDFFARIVVQAILEVLDCTNNPGPYINVSGSVTFDPGVKVRFVFRNQREAGAPHEADAIVDVTVVPEGFTLQIPKQPVQGGVGGNPWISVRTADSMGVPTSTETLLGRCVQLLPGN